MAKKHAVVPLRRANRTNVPHVDLEVLIAVARQLEGDFEQREGATTQDTAKSVYGRGSNERGRHDE